MKKFEKAPDFWEPTAWTTISIVIHGVPEQERLDALHRMLERYYQPIVLHIRASLSESQRDKAEDLAHDFILKRFHRMEFFENVSREKGRFRHWVKAAIRNFLRERLAPSSVPPPVSLQATDEEGQPSVEPTAPPVDPGLVLDRAWAQTVLEHALSALKSENESPGKIELFDALKGHLAREPKKAAAAAIASRLRTSGGAIHTAMSRLRSRFRKLIREEVRQTVGTKADWRDELKYLVDLLGQNPE